jgi:hypothetical protein
MSPKLRLNNVAFDTANNAKKERKTARERILVVNEGGLGEERVKVGCFRRE